MSTGSVVDVLLTQADLKLTQPEFIERVVEPALARLNQHHVPHKDETTTHMRITLRSFTDAEWDQFYPAPEDDT